MPTVKLSDKDLVAEKAEEIRLDRYRAFSRDELLCHPREALLLCEEVRMLLKLGKTEWTDSMILHAWLNAHKRSKFDPDRRGKHRPRAAKGLPSRRSRT